MLLMPQNYFPSGVVPFQGDPSTFLCALLMASCMIQSMQTFMFISSNNCKVPKKLGRNIINWVSKHHNDPVTGKKLEIKDLIKLNFERDTNGSYICPISKKELSQHKPILAIKNTGNVYSGDTVHTLNIKAKFWRDLITDTPFKRKDIIKILDPEDPSLRMISNFYYITQGIPLEDIIPALIIETKQEPSYISQKINANMTTLNTLKELNDKVSQKKLINLTKKEPSPITQGSSSQNSKGDTTNANYYSISTSASFTSTTLDPVVKGVLVKVNDEEYMFANVTGKAYVQIATNLGNLNFELFCENTPRTCYNFICLAKRGYYNNTHFHRLIPKFMVQGGDPTGTGRGGDSCWGSPFVDEFSRKLSHSSRGILSMANRGPGTNTSQFFITFGSCSHLDNKHTVFGSLVGGASVLKDIESIPTNRNDQPKQSILITAVNVFTNPFDRFTNPHHSNKA